MRNTKMQGRRSFLMILIFIALLMFTSARVIVVAQQTIKVPVGSTILLDGKLSNNEWNDANKIDIANVGSVYLKHDGRYLYIAIKTVKPEAASVDLYFERGGDSQLLDLHASAKLGERKGSFDSWPEWVWWNNDEWAANVARIDKFQPSPQFLADEAKEFQIDLSLVKGESLLLSADIQSLNGRHILPIEGTPQHGRMWFKLEL